MTRERLTGREPLHVTLRMVEGGMRKEGVGEIVRKVIEVAGRYEDFRIVEFVLLGNHLHFIVEAGGAVALARRMQGVTVRLARRINRAMGRKGKLFAERYHARVLKSPQEVRSALRYVLLNARRHAAERGEVLARGWVDPFSSAPWFDGWTQPVRIDQPWMRRLVTRDQPTATARTWLLREGWRRGGLLRCDDVPGRPGDET